MDYFKTETGHVRVVLSSVLEQSNKNQLDIINSMCNVITFFLESNKIKTEKDFVDLINGKNVKEFMKVDFIDCMMFMCEAQKALAMFYERQGLKKEEDLK